MKEILERFNKKKYKYLYRTTNIANGKTYIGVHCTDNLGDKYIGNGVKANFTTANKKKLTAFKSALLKYGVLNFKLEILAFYDTYEECLEQEKLLVNEQWVADNNNYNTTKGGVLHHVMYGSDNHMTKSVGCYRLDGTLYKMYECYSDAATELQLNVKNISSSVRKNFSTGGYIFIHNENNIYANEITPLNKKRGLGKRKKIQVMNLRTEEMYDLLSTKSLQEFIGIPKGTYDYHIKKKHKEFVYKDKWKVFVL